MSDQHSRGCDGLLRPPVRADTRISTGWRRAARASPPCWTPSPVCIPARASFATGKIHPPDRLLGQRRSLRRLDAELASPPARGRATRSCRSASCISAPTRRTRLLRVDHADARRRKQGRPLGLIRDDLPVRGAAYKMAKMAGPGESAYTQYDREIAARAQIWLREEAPKHTRQAVGAVRVVRRAALSADRAAGAFLSLLRRSEAADAACSTRDASGPPSVHRRLRTRLQLRRLFRDAATMCAARSPAISGCAASWTSRPARCWARSKHPASRADTRVIYTSDHGDAVGKRGLWGKSTLYEETVGVPLIVTGDGIPQGASVDTPANLVDVYPFIIDCVGETGRAWSSRITGRLDRSSRAGRAARAHGAERISRHGLDHRRVRDPQRPVQVRALRQIPAAAVRPGTAIRTKRTISPAIPATRHVAEGCEAKLRKLLSPETSMPAPRSARPSNWNATAAVKR